MKRNNSWYKDKSFLSQQVNIYVLSLVIIAVVAVCIYILIDVYRSDERRAEQSQAQAEQACNQGLNICNIRITNQTPIGQASENSERALVDIEWDQTAQPANYYLMQYKKSGDSEWQNCGVECFVGQANNKVEITLPRATTYDFQVRACSGQDCVDKGNWSPPFTFTTLE